MEIIDLGCTREVLVFDNIVIKKCLIDYKEENRKEYDNFVRYKDEDLKIVNNIISFKDDLIIAERCLTIEEYFETNNINEPSLYFINMDNLFINLYPELGHKLLYKEKRDYIIQNTELSTEEMTIPDNWGITKEGELVLIDYSR